MAKRYDLVREDCLVLELELGRRTQDAGCRVLLHILFLRRETMVTKNEIDEACRLWKDDLLPYVIRELGVMTWPKLTYCHLVKLFHV